LKPSQTREARCCRSPASPALLFTIGAALLHLPRDVHGPRPWIIVAMVLYLDGVRWLVAKAGKCGFVNLPSEAWHWSITGG
jgi:hypothetical protein